MLSSLIQKDYVHSQGSDLCLIRSCVTSNSSIAYSVLAFTSKLFTRHKDPLQELNGEKDSKLVQNNWIMVSNTG